MAALKTVVLFFAILAAVVAEETAPKDKRDILIGALPTMHYAAPAMHYAAPIHHYAAPTHHIAAPAAIPLHARTIAVPAYDDGKYYPGKYEKPTFYAAMPHMIAA